MTRDEIINLLSVAAAYDKRTLGEADIAAWSDAAERGRWGYEQAADAVKTHYAESDQWLMPGHVTRRIKDHRSEPPRSRALPKATPERAEDEHRRRVVSWFAERFQADHGQRSQEQRECLAVACPHCGATPNRPCWQTAGHRVLTDRAPIEIPHRDRRSAYRATKE